MHFKPPESWNVPWLRAAQQSWHWPPSWGFWLMPTSNFVLSPYWGVIVSSWPNPVKLVSVYSKKLLRTLFIISCQCLLCEVYSQEQLACIYFLDTALYEWAAARKHECGPSIGTSQGGHFQFHLCLLDSPLSFLFFCSCIWCMISCCVPHIPASLPPLYYSWK